MVAGTVAQLVALKRLLQPQLAGRRDRTHARSAMFLWGLSLLAAGVLLGVVQDGVTAI